MTRTFDLLEAAVRDRARLAFRRRGTEYVVVAIALETSGRRDELIARLPMTGDTLNFTIDELEDIARIP